MWDDIYKPNSIGSEGGTIIVDEEYKESCIILLLIDSNRWFLWNNGGD